MSAAAKAKEEPPALVRKAAKARGKGKGKGRGKSTARSREEPSDCVEVSKDFYKRATDELSFQIHSKAASLAPVPLRRWRRCVRRVAAKLF